MAMTVVDESDPMVMEEPTANVWPDMTNAELDSWVMMLLPKLMTGAAVVAGVFEAEVTPPFCDKSGEAAGCVWALPCTVVVGLLALVSASLVPVFVPLVGVAASWLVLGAVVSGVCDVCGVGDCAAGVLSSDEALEIVVVLVAKMPPVWAATPNTGFTVISGFPSQAAWAQPV
jgi:hypothetical protein